MFTVTADNKLVAEYATVDHALTVARKHLALGAVVRILAPDGRRFLVTN